MRVAARSVFVATAIEVFAANFLNIEVPFGAQAKFDDIWLFHDECYHANAPNREDKIDDTLGIATLYIEIFVIFFAKANDARIVLVNNFHTIE